MNKKILPQGDKIRQLLIKTTLTSNNISKLLREKGVYLGDNTKSNSVPLLMKSIISPDDFTQLYERQKTKEEKKKYLTSSIECSKDFNFINILPQVDLNSEISKKHTYDPGYKVIGNPNFVIIGDTATINYEINRVNHLNDWTNNKTKHTGSVTLKKSSKGNIQVSVQKNYTTNETNEVNSIIVNQITKSLRLKSFIKQDQDFISIKLSDFNNSNRFEFFKEFTNSNNYLEFKSITDITLQLDDSSKIHEDLKEFLHDIENLKIKSKDLQNHILLSKKKYHPEVIFSSITIKYKLNYLNDIKGNVTLILQFPNYINSKSKLAELEATIDLKIDKENRKNEEEIRKKLLDDLEVKKISFYNKHKNATE